MQVNVLYHKGEDVHPTVSTKEEVKKLNEKDVKVEPLISVEATAPYYETITPAQGYDALSEVVISVDAPDPKLETQSVTGTAPYKDRITHRSEYDGIDYIDIDIAAPEDPESPIHDQTFYVKLKNNETAETFYYDQSLYTMVSPISASKTYAITVPQYSGLLIFTPSHLSYYYYAYSDSTLSFKRDIVFYYCPVSNAIPLSNVDHYFYGSFTFNGIEYSYNGLGGASSSVGGDKTITVTSYAVSTLWMPLLKCKEIITS